MLTKWSVQQCDDLGFPTEIFPTTIHDERIHSSTEGRGVGDDVTHLTKICVDPITIGARSLQKDYWPTHHREIQDVKNSTLLSLEGGLIGTSTRLPNRSARSLYHLNFRRQHRRRLFVRNEQRYKEWQSWTEKTRKQSFESYLSKNSRNFHWGIVRNWYPFTNSYMCWV